MISNKYIEFVDECMRGFKHESSHITLMYLASGLIEETQELNHKLNSTNFGLHEKISEAGDVLWYVVALRNMLSLDLQPKSIDEPKSIMDISISTMSIIRNAVFFDKYDSSKEQKLIDLLCRLSTEIPKMLGVSLVTITDSNILKLKMRYGSVRETSYINKDVEMEDKEILKNLQ